MIKFLDLQKINLQYQNEIEAKLLEVFRSGWYLMGNQLSNFEKNLSDYIGAKHSIGVANGLDALRLILRAYMEMGVMKAGDEIIVPSNTYIASILAISDNGLTPVLVEPEINTYNIDISKIEEKITSKTKGILIVHLQGRVVFSV
jgi:dTDP-4-amino-4,6-dideoxygalactose transaminase